MAAKKPKTPSNLRESGAKLWRSIVAQVSADDLVLDARELRWLHDACREADQLALLEAALEEAPLMVLGSQRQPVANPMISEARRCRSLIASLLRRLSLDDPDADKGKGRGSRTTSTSARGAAFSRHYGNAGGTG
jgi:phage terminase small subunit